VSRKPATAQLDEIPTKRCSCGNTRRAFADEPGRVVSVHLLDTEDARPHYHKRATEVYVVLRGEGYVELDGVKHEAKPMAAFLIPPGVRHRASDGLQVLVIPVPAADDTDEYFDV
jgi:mannose-6-phosphate isomerase-like protein (cupin superfamily)